MLPQVLLEHSRACQDTAPKSPICRRNRIVNLWSVIEACEQLGGDLSSLGAS
jgi:hypothetical protein